MPIGVHAINLSHLSLLALALAGPQQLAAVFSWVPKAPGPASTTACKITDSLRAAARYLADRVDFLQIRAANLTRRVGRISLRLSLRTHQQSSPGLARLRVRGLSREVTMMLSKFIVQNLELILEAWESFARRLLPAAEGMDAKGLRNHGKQILEAVAKDMEMPQTDEEQFKKSVGLADDGSDSAASIHGSLRQESDFTMMQLAAEYRALRATVLRLWIPQITDVGEALDDIVRFNEAIDQALAESIVTFTGRTMKTRDMFIAMLGHDLRGPLATMTTAGQMLRNPGISADRAADLGTRISRGASLMTSMVADLADYTRTQLGDGLPLSRRHLDLRDTCSWSLDDARSLHPDVDFDFIPDGDLRGSFDGVRLHRLLTNLLGNAAQHGQKGTPVVLQARRMGKPSS